MSHKSPTIVPHSWLWQSRVPPGATRNQFNQEEPLGGNQAWLLGEFSDDGLWARNQRGLAWAGPDKGGASSSVEDGNPLQRIFVALLLRTFQSKPSTAEELIHLVVL